MRKRQSVRIAVFCVITARNAHGYRNVLQTDLSAAECKLSWKFGNSELLAVILQREYLAKHTKRLQRQHKEPHTPHERGAWLCS